MVADIIIKERFSVIGKKGQGRSDSGFQWIPSLWKEANEHFAEIGDLAKGDNGGKIVGIWGAMSDIDERFERWREEGKYLAGCEVSDDAAPPSGWSKWTIPGYKYAVIKCTQESYGEAFNYMLNEYMPQNQYNIVGAVHEYYPQDGSGNICLYFPIERL